MVTVSYLVSVSQASRVGAFLTSAVTLLLPVAPSPTIKPETAADYQIISRRQRSRRKRRPRNRRDAEPRRRRERTHPSPTRSPQPAKPPEQRRNSLSRSLPARADKAAVFIPAPAVF